MNEVPRIPSTLQRGELLTAEQLLPLVYDELRQLAAQRLAREKPGQLLQATALVHEAYLRLVKSETIRRWDSRGHFFAAASEAMRRILVEHARRMGREKHGGGRRREHAQLDDLSGSDSPQDFHALHEALVRFARHDPLKAKLVELRFFDGLTLEQAARCLNVSLSTADRAWRYARTWLYAAMADAAPDEKVRSA